MTTAQTDTPAATAGENTGATETSQATENDGFVDFDAFAPETATAQEGDFFGDDAATGEPTGQGEGDGTKKPDAEAKTDGDDKAKKEEEEKKRLSGAQRAKLQRQSLLDQLAERDRQIEELRKTSQKPADDASADKPPKEEDFNGDWFAFQRALTAYDAGKAAREATQAALKAEQDRDHNARLAREAGERRDAHLDRVEKAREVITDFDTVMEGMKGINVRNGVIDEIMSAENSALVAYHFAQHPDELAALNDMTPREVTRAVAKIDATAKLPEPKTVTTAPPPLKTPKGGANPRSQESDLSAWLNKTYGPKRSA